MDVVVVVVMIFPVFTVTDEFNDEMFHCRSLCRARSGRLWLSWAGRRFHFQTIAVGMAGPVAWRSGTLYLVKLTAICGR